MPPQGRPGKYGQSSWPIFVGDFGVLNEFLAEKERPAWAVLRLFNGLLRGYGQVVCANNPISGFLIIIGLGATAPVTLLSSMITGVLGLLLSVLIRESEQRLHNGLTVYNPLLVGAFSVSTVPVLYGGTFDSFSLLLVLLGTIISVYLTRSWASDRSPCMLWPFNLAELAVILVLLIQNEHSAALITDTDNATSDAATTTATTTTMKEEEVVVVVAAVGSVTGNGTGVHIDWGLVLHGIVASGSRTYEVESVALGSVVYLAILIFSPTTACFAFVGALVGSLSGLVLGVPLDEVYSGCWGLNSLLTGAVLGGNSLILNGQCVAATLVAIVFAILVQYAVRGLLVGNTGFPVLTVPFLIAATLFVRLRNDPEDTAFVRPGVVSFPEMQRRDYYASRTATEAETEPVDQRSHEKAGLSSGIDV